MEQELKIKINGDIEGLKKATEDAGKHLDTLTSAQSRVRSGIRELNKTALDYERQLSALTKSYRDGGISQEKYAKESEKLQVSLSYVRNEISAYQRESNRLTKEIDRSKRAFEQSALSTGKDTVAKKTNANADMQAARATRQLEAAQRRQAEAQRQALMGANSMGRAMTGMAVGGRSAAIGVGALTRALSTMAVSSTAATGGMAAFTSALMGPAGITVAVSLAVTALTGYIASKASAKRATEDGASANRTYIETLEGIARASAEGEQAANRDLTSLRLLYEATQNLSLPMEARLKAARELLDQYPKQFEGMTTEAILAGRAASAYNQLTASITATAMAAANLDRIRENSNKILNNRLEMLQAQVDLNELNSRIEREEARTPLPGRRSGQSGEALDAADAARLNRLYEQREGLISKINNLGRDSGKITDENIQLQREYNDQILKGADLSGSISTSLDKIGSKTKENRDKFADQILRDEERLRIALEEGRNKEIAQAEARYLKLLELADGNNEKILQAQDLLRREIARINADWDRKEEEAAIKGEERINERNTRIAENALKIRNKILSDQNKARIKEEERLLKELDRQNRRYARMLSSELSRAFEGFLSKGENVFKALGDAFKRMIIRMVAEAAALRTIQWVQGAMGSGGSGNNWGAWIRTILNVGSRFIGSGGGGGASGMASARITDVGASPVINANVGASVFIADTRLRGQDQLIQFSRANRFNERFNGGQ